jgi:hypothetical protein
VVEPVDRFTLRTIGEDTCSGHCPICGMALEPVLATAKTGDSPELRVMTRRFWIGPCSRVAARSSPRISSTLRCECRSSVELGLGGAREPFEQLSPIALGLEDGPHLLTPRAIAVEAAVLELDAG